MPPTLRKPSAGRLTRRPAARLRHQDVPAGTQPSCGGNADPSGERRQAPPDPRGLQTSRPHDPSTAWRRRAALGVGLWLAAQRGVRPQGSRRPSSGARTRAHGHRGPTDHSSEGWRRRLVPLRRCRAGSQRARGPGARPQRDSDDVVDPEPRLLRTEDRRVGEHAKEMGDTHRFQAFVEVELPAGDDRRRPTMVTQGLHRQRPSAERGGLSGWIAGRQADGRRHAGIGDPSVVGCGRTPSPSSAPQPILRANMECGGELPARLFERRRWLRCPVPHVAYRAVRTTPPNIPRVCNATGDGGASFVP